MGVDWLQYGCGLASIAGQARVDSSASGKARFAGLPCRSRAGNDASRVVGRNQEKLALPALV